MAEEDDKAVDAASQPDDAATDSAFPINISDIDLSQVMGGLAQVASARAEGTTMCCW
jgi:hypothetical protein